MKLFKVISLVAILSITGQMLAAEGGVVRDPKLKEIMAAYLSGKEYTVLAFGEGAKYNNFNDQTMRADVTPIVEPDVLLDVTDVTSLKILPANSFDEIRLCGLPTPLFDINSSEPFIV